MVRVARGVLVVLLGLAACGDDGTAEPADTTADSTTTTTAEPTTTTDPPPDPSVIPEDPADLDEDYVEAVLAELMHLDGEVLRIARRDGPSPELAERTNALYSPELAATRLSLLAGLVAAGFPDIAPVPGDVTSQVERVLVAENGCVSSDTLQDFTAVGPGAATEARTQIELHAAQPSELNPTAWIIAVRQPWTTPDPPVAPCAIVG